MDSLKNDTELTSADDKKKLDKKLKEIMFVSFNRKSIRKDSQEHPFIQQISVDATIYHCDFSKERKIIDFIFIKDLSSGQWKIAENIAEQL